MLPTCLSNIFTICLKTWHNPAKSEIPFIMDYKGDIAVLDHEILLSVGEHSLCCN